MDKNDTIDEDLVELVDKTVTQYRNTIDELVKVARTARLRESLFSGHPPMPPII
jgi:hypothetical protein